MELITILNRCHRFRGSIYHQAQFSADKKCIEVAVPPRKGSVAVCPRCRLPAPGYDQLAERRFEFIPLWGFLVFLLYSMRRVDCRRCEAVVVEEVPWGDGKHTLTNAYMLFLARWAHRLSWKETAEAFHTSWEKVFDAVEHVVTFGLANRTLGQIDAIGVDEIQYARGHTYLTLVYQIDLDVTRLLWVGKERTLTWQNARARINPRFLLTNQISKDSSASLSASLCLRGEQATSAFHDPRFFTSSRPLETHPEFSRNQSLPSSSIWYSVPRCLKF